MCGLSGDLGVNVRDLRRTISALLPRRSGTSPYPVVGREDDITEMETSEVMRGWLRSLPSGNNHWVVLRYDERGGARWSQYASAGQDQGGEALQEVVQLKVSILKACLYHMRCRTS